MDTASFDYDLPDFAIAQTPAEPRSSARLLVDRGPTDPPEDRSVADLASLVGPGDLLVVNDTRVWPTRLLLSKATGGAAEVLLLEPVRPGTWQALVRPGRRVAPGTVLGDDTIRIEVQDRLPDGRRLVGVSTVDPGADVDDVLARCAHLALPPYIHEPLTDPERYQTTFAAPADGDEAPAAPGASTADIGDTDFVRRLRSVAAPTAGLHLTPEVLDACRLAGASVATVRLAVGLGTFRPISTDTVEDHVMHAERYRVPAEVLEQCERAERVLAVGTTVVRALESAVRIGPGEHATDLFIAGDHEWRVVDRLLTNFHVPRSSLLVLVDAFVGPRWARLYREALDRGYRFLSFGDAMVLDRRWGRAT